MPRHQLTHAERSRGGLAVAAIPPPNCCPRCPKSRFRSWHQYIGHLGLHGFADRYCGGDLRAAARKFNLLGIAATDPIPWNGAFAEAHRVADEIKKQQTDTS